LQNKEVTELSSKAFSAPWTFFFLGQCVALRRVMLHREKSHGLAGWDAGSTGGEELDVATLRAGSERRDRSAGL